MLLFELEEPLVTSSQPMAFHDFLDGWLGAVFAFQFQELLNVATSFLRVLSDQFQHAFLYFERCCVRVGFMNGWQISQSFKALLLEAFPVFVELGGWDSPFSTYPADVTVFFGQFERFEALVHDFRFCLHFLLATLF